MSSQDQRTGLGSPPVVDLVLPAYNAAATIADSIASLRAQSLAAIRIIVVDDGSTDDTAAIVDGMAREDPRIELVRQPNQGIVGALNAGLMRCSAAYFARLDADDIAYPDRLAEQLGYLERNPDCVAVGVHARVIDGEGRPTGAYAEPGSTALADPDHLPAIEPYIMHPFLMARRASVEAVGGYRYCYHSEDTDLYWRLAELGRLHNLDAVLGDYRIHPGSITSGSVANARLMAFWSQLSAISAKRRRTGEPDLVFSPEKVARSKSCASMEALFEGCTDDLSAAEREHFRIAFAMKMAQLLMIRWHIPGAEDCRFIRDAQERSWPGLSVEARRAVASLVAQLSVYLARKGQLGLAQGVLPPRLYRQAVITFAATLVRRLGRAVLARRSAAPGRS